MPSSTPPAGLRLDELAALCGATVAGDGATRIGRVGTLEHAGPGDIAFLANPRYRAQLATTRAAAVIVAPGDAGSTTLPRLIAPDPYATFARVANVLHPPEPAAPGIHPTAVVDPSASVAPTATVGPCAVIGARASIGERASIGAHCAVGDEASIGEDAVLDARVSVYARCVIGPRTLIHSGAVIGADGFGLAHVDGKWLKIPQIGRVVVGADVEIGANTTIDRGAIDDTRIEDGVKLDNQIQIGHNCSIGAHTAIAGCVGIAGSTRIGQRCRIGGAAMISGHLDIADGTVISGATLIHESITVPGVYTGVFPALPHREWKQVASQTRRLRELAERVKALERALARSRSDNNAG
ncbi:MAG TPA: UDP-3-O-(3-hydroxymyristoyl)glucosamine N-acyltransferase [Casimicrobiaceae bacterium]|nr:UDP-3-O-(3-hydroxymyristoyl)glucosamine N-acyltransferase [Casimicrobiaceae bacterium]